MSRGQTILDARYGALPGVAALSAIWTDDLINTLLNVIWEAYDRLLIQFASQIAWDEEYDDLERSITQEFEREIRRGRNAYLPCDIQHGPYEKETRAKAPAQPPQYDLAFVFTDDTRLMWPLEAKVLKTDKATDAGLNEYIKAIKENYLTCRYAPLSNSGAMLGYLKVGNPDSIFANIATGLSCTLNSYSPLPRHHKTSDHIRAVPTGKNYPPDFHCHHLVLVMSAQPTQVSSATSA